MWGRATRPSTACVARTLLSAQSVQLMKLRWERDATIRVSTFSNSMAT